MSAVLEGKGALLWVSERRRSRVLIIVADEGSILDVENVIKKIAGVWPDYTKHELRLDRLYVSFGRVAGFHVL